MYLAQGSANFSVKGQKVNFYFVGHTVSITTTQFCRCSVYHPGFFRETSLYDLFEELAHNCEGWKV